MTNSYKGKILISTPDNSGDIFSRSVILVVQHDDNGAFGLILNKKNIEMSRHLGRIFSLPVEIYAGGPVENDKVFFIVKGNPVTENHTEINDQFYLCEDLDVVVENLVNDHIEMTDVKVFSGYSGWSTSQLEAEIEQKMWTVVDANNLDYTTPNDHNLWKNIMNRLGGEYLIWANTPEDASLN